MTGKEDAGVNRGRGRLSKENTKGSSTGRETHQRVLRPHSAEKLTHPVPLCHDATFPRTLLPIITPFSLLFARSNAISH